MNNLDPRRGGPDTLLMLSGGVDSVWALWHHLTTTDTPIRVHHVHMHNAERRANAEARAVRRVLSWVRDQGWRDRVHYTESRIDFGHLNWVPMDHHTWGLFAGTILGERRSRSITKVIRAYASDAFRNEQARVTADENWMNLIHRVSYRTDVQLTHPMVHLSKAEVVHSMPTDLLTLCWWCRRPRGGGRACHQCRTCQQVDAALGRHVPTQPRKEDTVDGEDNRVPLIALQSFNGLEGRVRRGQQFRATPARAQFLVTRGLAERALAERVTRRPVGPTETKPAGPTELGGGWYEVNGQKVQGRAAAETLARQASP